jgi:hypothetical protein
MSLSAAATEYPAVIIPVLTQHYAMLQRTCSIRMSRAAKQKFDAIEQIEVRD